MQCWFFTNEYMKQGLEWLAITGKCHHSTGFTVIILGDYANKCWGFNLKTLAAFISFSTVHFFSYFTKLKAKPRLVTWQVRCYSIRLHVHYSS